MGEKPERHEVLRALRLANERGATDQEVALIAAGYIEGYTQDDLTPITLARTMSKVALRRVTDERAEHLLEQLGEAGLTEPDE